MKGISVSEFGGPEVCKFRTDLPVPKPEDDQVQIRVHAVGINPIDTYICAGITVRPKLPFTPGLDSAGVVSCVGKNVKNLKVGDRVFTTSSVTGTYAEYTVCQVDTVFQLPDNMTFNEGSALGVPYFAAYKSLFLKTHAQPGETVLVHGASGSTGIACVQIAKASGLTVIGTAGTQAGLEMVKKIGADYVFNHTESNYLDKIKEKFPDGIEIILEMSAHTNLNKDVDLLKMKKGRIVVIGCRGPVEINPLYLMAKEAYIVGVMQLLSDKDEFSLMNHHLQSLMKLNCIKPVISKVYPLEKAGQAQHDVINNSGSSGRLTLQI